MGRAEESECVILANSSPNNGVPLCASGGRSWRYTVAVGLTCRPSYKAFGSRSAPSPRHPLVLSSCRFSHDLRGLVTLRCKEMAFIARISLKTWVSIRVGGGLNGFSWFGSSVIKDRSQPILHTTLKVNICLSQLPFSFCVFSRFSPGSPVAARRVRFPRPSPSLRLSQLRNPLVAPGYVVTGKHKHGQLSPPVSSVCEAKCLLSRRG